MYIENTKNKNKKKKEEKWVPGALWQNDCSVFYSYSVFMLPYWPSIEVFLFSHYLTERNIYEFSTLYFIEICLINTNNIINCKVELRD